MVYQVEVAPAVSGKYTLRPSSALRDSSLKIGYVVPQTSGTLRSEYFFAGGRGPVFQETFYGETSYDKTDSLATVANVWSACGASVNMCVNTSMVANGAGVATVDSFDLTHRGMIYHIKYRNCR
jgi:hypothetical protein